MPVTIYDIATKAGVSSSTVARVLRGNTRGERKDSAARAARIRRIADQLGYRPNLRARAFSEGRTKGIGLLYIQDEWIFEGVNDKVVQGLVKELRRLEHHLLLAPIDSSGDWRDLVLGGHIDGCLTFQRLPDDVRQCVRHANLPCVLLGDNSDPDLPHIVVADYEGAYAATRHLVGLGHERIGYFIHERVKPHCSIGERRRGYETCLAEHGLAARIWQTSESDVVESLLRPGAPTALLCYSDLESTLMMHALWQIGAKVPRDISLIGFNQVFSTEFMTPPLTTVAFDAASIGRLGAQLILSSLQDSADGDVEKQPSKSHVVKTKLIVRGSTAPPPGSV
jgi:DNA-binding LacI/PurR family transcriptional regulator